MVTFALRECNKVDHKVDSVYREPLKTANYSYYILVRVTANILKFTTNTQLPSKVETINTEGQGRPISVYFV